MGYQDTDKCCLCSAQETSEHMLRCNHNTRMQWRWRTIKAMQGSMTKHNVEERIINLFCSYITDWLDSGSAGPSKHGYRYNQSIVTQNLIGWRHVFMGKLSQEWLTLQTHATDNHGNKRSNYIWVASDPFRQSDFLAIFRPIFGTYYHQVPIVGHAKYPIMISYWQNAAQWVTIICNNIFVLRVYQLTQIRVLSDTSEKIRRIASTRTTVNATRINNQYKDGIQVLIHRGCCIRRRVVRCVVAKRGA